MAFLTASGAPSTKGNAARPARTTSSASSPRRRRARDLPYLRPLSVVAFRALLPRNPRPELLGLPLESIQARVVFYHDVGPAGLLLGGQDRKSTRLNSSHANISYAVFCLKKKNTIIALDTT